MKLKKTLLEILKSKNTNEQLKKLDDIKELENIIPKVNEMKEFGECKYHVVNCFDHSIYSVREFEDILQEENFFSPHLKSKVFEYLNTKTEENITKLDLLKLGIFIHDIGKPDAKTTDENGRVHFRGHEKVGAEIALELGNNLGLSKESIDTLFKYVRYHMILLVSYKNNNLNKETMFKLFDEIGEDIIGIIILGYADIVATRKLLDPKEPSEITKTYMEFMLTNYEYRYKRVK